MTHHLRSVLAGLFALVVLAPGGAVAGYVQTDLVTSATDPDLINPWGISFSATSPFWVSDNGTGKATLYNSTGVKQGLVVSMPTGGGGVKRRTDIQRRCQFQWRPFPLRQRRWDDRRLASSARDGRRATVLTYRRH